MSTEAMTTYALSDEALLARRAQIAKAVRAGMSQIEAIDRRLAEREKQRRRDELDKHRPKGLRKQLGITDDNEWFAYLAARQRERQVLELMVEDIVVRKIYTSLGLPPVSEQEAQDLSEKSGMTVRDAGSYIRKAALMEMMVRSRVVVTENMIRSHYENQPQYRGRDSVRLNQILIRKDSAKAARALDELNAGKPFAEVAGRYSDVLSSGSADIGWVAVEDLSEELRASLKAAKPGDVVGPLSVSGYTAFYQLVERGVHGARPLEEVRNEITADLQKKYQLEAFNHWLKKMMSQYFIGIYI